MVASRSAIIEEETAYMIRVQEGDNEAYGLFYSRYYDQIFHYVKRKVQNPFDVENLVQEVFYKAFKSRGTYKPGLNPYSAYLHSVANSVISDYYSGFPRLESDISLEGLASKTNSPESVIECRELMGVVKDGFESLKEKDQMLFRLRMEGYKYSDIEQITGMPSTNAKARIHRIRTYLGNFVRQYEKVV